MHAEVMTMGDAMHADVRRAEQHTHGWLDVLGSFRQNHSCLQLFNPHVIKAGAQVHQEPKLALGAAVQEALQRKAVAWAKHKTV